MNGDPRVQQARELLAGTIRADHESEDARSTIRDLLALVDDHRKVLDAQQDKWMRESVRADRAEAERDRLQATVERVEALADHWRNVEMPEAPVADEVLTAALNGDPIRSGPTGR